MKNARKEIENPVCAIFAHTAADGKTYKTQFYALQEDWATRLDSQAKLHAETEWEKYRIIQDKLFESDFDQFLENEMSLKTLTSRDSTGS
jgi:hypothetical protein